MDVDEYLGKWGSYMLTDKRPDKLVISLVHTIKTYHNVAPFALETHHIDTIYKQVLGKNIGFFLQIVFFPQHLTCWTWQMTNHRLNINKEEFLKALI